MKLRVWDAPLRGHGQFFVVGDDLNIALMPLSHSWMVSPRLKHPKQMREDKLLTQQTRALVRATPYRIGAGLT